MYIKKRIWRFANKFFKGQRKNVWRKYEGVKRLVRKLKD